MKSCTVENCLRKYYSKGHCRKHYDKVRNHGSAEKRTKKDPNEIIIYEDYAEIVLYFKNKEYARTPVDLADVGKIKKYKWYKTPEGYVKAERKRINGKKISAIFLHRLIMNFPDNMVDHIDRNKINNRRHNLRVTDRIGNSRNKGIQSNNTSGVVGVHWHKQNKKWYAHIVINKKEIFLGLFTDLAEAKAVRIKAEHTYFGDYRSNANDS